MENEESGRHGEKRHKGAWLEAAVHTGRVTKITKAPRSASRMPFCSVPLEPFRLAPLGGPGCSNVQGRKDRARRSQVGERSWAQRTRACNRGEFARTGPLSCKTGKHSRGDPPHGARTSACMKSTISDWQERLQTHLLPGRGWAKEGEGCQVGWGSVVAG